MVSIFGLHTHIPHPTIEHIYFMLELGWCFAHYQPHNSQALHKIARKIRENKARLLNLGDNLSDILTR